VRCARVGTTKYGASIIFGAKPGGLATQQGRGSDVMYERPGSVSRLGPPTTATIRASQPSEKTTISVYIKFLGGSPFRRSCFFSSRPACVSRFTSLTQSTHSLLWTRNPDFDGFLMQPTDRRQLSLQSRFSVLETSGPFRCYSPRLCRTCLRWTV
jgi:hypothetical protein